MAIASYETSIVAGEFITVELLVWRRYRREARGVVEATLDANPHLARLHRASPFLPVGTEVNIPIDPEVLAGAPSRQVAVVLYGTL